MKFNLRLRILRWHPAVLALSLVLMANLSSCEKRSDEPEKSSDLTSFPNSAFSENRHTKLRQTHEESLNEIEQLLRTISSDDDKSLTELRNILSNLSRLMERWVQEDPAAARAWLDHMPELAVGEGNLYDLPAGTFDLQGVDPFLHAALRGMVSGLALDDPEAAITLAIEFQLVDLDNDDSLISMRIDPGLDLLSYSLRRMLEEDRFHEALTFANILPSGSNASALTYQLSKAWAKSDPDGFAKQINGHPEQFESPAWSGVDFQKDAYRGSLKTDPVWVMNQDEGLDVFPDWLGIDGPKAREWLNSQPSAPSFDSARISAYRQLANSDYGQSDHFETRLELLNQLSSEADESDVTFYRRELMIEWEKHDKATLPEK